MENITLVPTSDRRLLRARDLATVLAVAEASIWAWRRYGDVPALQMGAAVRFVLDDVLEWVRAGGPGRATERRRQVIAERALRPRTERHPGGRPPGSATRRVRRVRGGA